MRILNISLLALLFLASFSCKKSDDSAVVIDATVDIQLVNDQNENVIGQVQSVDFNNLKIYYLVDEKTELYYKGNLEYPKGYIILENPNKQKYLRLFLNTQGVMPITLIQFNEADTDTVKCKFHKKDGSIICTKVWYNNVLKWDVNDNNSSENRQITIVKNF